jgi:GNAT superfamily N-acetyltransferase
MNCTIRKGRREDLPQVLKLIKELALYEKAPQEVTNTVDDMEKDGFGENPIYGLFVAEQEGRIIGIAIYYTKYSTWKGKCIYLDDIVITESERCKGIGRKLFEEVIKVSKVTGANRMEWQVLEWNTPAIEFYKKFNAVLDPEWINGKFTKEQLASYTMSEGPSLSKKEKF